MKRILVAIAKRDLEQIVQGLQIFVRPRVAGQGPEAGDRAVEQLVGGGVEHHSEGLAVGGGQVAELAGEAAAELGLEDGAGAGAEGHDGRGQGLLLGPGLEASGLLGGDGAGAGAKGRGRGKGYTCGIGLAWPSLSTLSFGDGYPMQLQGGVVRGEPGAPPTIKLTAYGVVGTKTAGWVYSYIGFLAPTWAYGVDQRTTIVGTVTRVVPHGSSPAGVVASFVAVKH